MSLYFNQASPGDMLMCVMVDRDDCGGSEADKGERRGMAPGLTF